MGEKTPTPLDLFRRAVFKVMKNDPEWVKQHFENKVRENTKRREAAQKQDTKNEKEDE